MKKLRVGDFYYYSNFDLVLKILKIEGEVALALVVKEDQSFVYIKRGGKFNCNILSLKIEHKKELILWL